MKIPASVLSDAFLASYAQGKDPLAKFVRDVAPQEGYWSSAHILQMLLLATRTEFDPNAKVDSLGFPSEDRKSPLLSYVLSKCHSENKSPSPVQPQAPVWPRDVRGFEDLMGKPWTGQALAALLLAAGADPWVDRSPENPLGTALPAALSLGMPGLADVMLEKPGAPSLDEVFGLSASFPVADPYEWSRLACSSEGVLFDWFLEKSLPWPLTERFHPLEEAAPGVVFRLAALDRLPQEKKVLARLRQVWHRRMKETSLSPSDWTRMVQILDGEPDSPGAAKERESLYLATAIQTVSANTWGSWVNPAFSIKAKIVATESVVDFLNTKTTIPSGPMAGTWSQLAAQACMFVKSCRWTEGIQPWSLEGCINKISSQESVAAGALAPSLGFDWQPGVKIDGVVALALLAQRQESSIVADPKVQWEENLVAAGRLFGKTPVKEWLQDHVEDAVAFSEVQLKKNVGKTARTLLAVWHNVLKNHPHWLEGRPDLLTRLLRGFHRDYREGSWSSFNPSSVFDGQIFTAGRKDAPPAHWETLCAEDRRLLLEVALTLRKERVGWPEAIRGGLEASAFDLEDVARIEKWSAQQIRGSSSAIFGEIQAMARSSRLSLTLGEAEPSKGIRHRM